MIDDVLNMFDGMLRYGIPKNDAKNICCISDFGFRFENNKGAVVIIETFPNLTIFWVTMFDENNRIPCIKANGNEFPEVQYLCRNNTEILEALNKIKSM